jgi:uncharacterized protein (TIGR02145 family)
MYSVRCLQGEPSLCGDKAYDPATQFCYDNGKIVDFCGSRKETFDPDLYECKAGDKIYLKTPVSYGGQNYDAVLIGEQTWMAKNLNYNAPGSACNNNVPANCDTYGRMYEWETALTVCPTGWHLPSYAEYNDLIEFVGGEKLAAKHLKAKSGWEYKDWEWNEWFPNENGWDTYGFAALPGGFYQSYGQTTGGGHGTGIWSSSEKSSCEGMPSWNSCAYELNIWGEEDGNVAYMTYARNYDSLASVRCMKDD